MTFRGSQGLTIRLREIVDLTPMDELFSVKDVARIFGLSESKIRYWAQTGFINPTVQRGTRRYYTFFDLIGIKTAKELLDSGLSLQAVRKNLDELRKVLPQVERPLSNLRIRSDGDRVVVVADDVAFEAESRQTLLDFRTGHLQDEVARLLNLARPVVDLKPVESPDESEPGTEGKTAYQWFCVGLSADEKEETQHKAAEAYRNALRMDPSMAAAHTNLGNVYFKSGRLADARAHYERALSLDPDQPEARFNLANIYEEEGKLELAISEYRRVVTSCPDFPDAHFNLALALEQVGSRVQSSRHFEQYLELDSDEESLWVKMAQSHLKRLES